MQQLNLPPNDLKIKKENDTLYVFDELRRKYLVLTPEEWVRQHFVHFLIQHKGYPKGLITLEKGLKLNELQKRADAIVADKNGHPILLLEFKAPKVKITQETFAQIARYNTVFQVPYLVVSNGLKHYCAKINFDSESFEFLKDVPTYADL